MIDWTDHHRRIESLKARLPAEDRELVEVLERAVEVLTADAKERERKLAEMEAQMIEAQTQVMELTLRPRPGRVM